MDSKRSFLPLDEEIYERSKMWSNFMARTVQEETNKSMYFDEIVSDCTDESNSGSNESENSPKNKLQALVKSNNFEGSSSSDEYDVNNLLSETLPIIEERKRKWMESGMDRILDTFDVKAITDKVGSWLEKCKVEHNTTANDASIEEQVVHFENHRINFNSDESLQSADTAKYILSNRKHRSASCTTMTIKRFRYVKGKQNELARKYNNLGKFDEIDEMFKNRCTELIPKSRRLTNRAMSEDTALSGSGNNLQPKVCTKTCRESATKDIKVNEQRPPKEESRKYRQKSRLRKRRSGSRRMRSYSMSSSSSSTPEQKKLKLRRSGKSLKPSCVNLTELATTTSEGEISKKSLAPAVDSAANREVVPPTADFNQQKSSNETCFLPENLVNSTAVPQTNVINPKNCVLSPIVEKNPKTPQRHLKIKCRNILNTNKESSKMSEASISQCPIVKEDTNTPLRRVSRETLKSSEVSVSQCPNSEQKILLYTPENQLETTSGESFKLTKEHLENSIGRKAARRFLRLNSQKLPLEFDSSATVYFQLPSTECNHKDSTDDSEEDTLDIIAKIGDVIVQRNN